MTTAAIEITARLSIWIVQFSTKIIQFRRIVHLIHYETHVDDWNPMVLFFFFSFFWDNKKSLPFAKNK